MENDKNKHPVEFNHIFRIGGYRNEIAAKIDETELMTSEAFRARTSLFGYPDAMEITVEPLGIEREHIPNKLGFDEYILNLTVAITAPDMETANEWIKHVKARVDNLSPTTYVRIGAVRPEKTNED